MTLHGRNAERRVLATLVEAGSASHSGVLVVRGQPGMGKSALLEDSVSRHGDVQVLRARGTQTESRLPFAALHQLLRPVLDCLERLPDHHAGALRAAIGIDPSRGTDRFLVAVATLGALAEAAERSPVVCLIDDAQWLDAASSEALLFAARRLDVERVVMLFAARSTDDSDTASFPAEGLPELRLSGVDAEAAAGLLHDRVGRPVDPMVCRRLVEETGGNPLALLELTVDLTPEQLSGTKSLPLRLPLTDRLERLFAARAGRLSPPARKALLVAAADDTGRLRTVLIAAAALGGSTGTLDGTEQAGLVRIRDGVLTFRHPLVRSAIYQAATAGERREAHRALAAVMDAHGEADRRAWHLAAAAVEPDGMVVAELDAAAERAHVRGGYEAAGAALERAADLTTDPAARCRRLVSAAENDWLAGRFTRVAALLQTARPLASEPLLRADIGQLRAWCELSIGSATAALRLLLDAAEETVHIDAQRAGRLLAAAAAAAWFTPDIRGGHELGRIAARLEPPPDGSDDRFFADTFAGYLCLLEGDLPEAFRALTAAIGLAERLDQPELLAFAGHHAFVVGDDEAAVRLNAQVVGLARVTGQVNALLFGLPRLAVAELGAGRWTAAEADAAEAVRLAREIGQPDLAALPTAWLCLLAALRGDSDGFWSRAAEAGHLADTHPLGVAEGRVRDVVRWGRAVHKATLVRPATAATLLGELSDPLIVDMATLDGIESAVLAGRREEALRWLAPLEAFGATTGAAWSRARAAHGHALLSDGEVAEAYFEEALSHHERAKRPFERARTLLAYGEFLRRARRRGTARAPLEVALDAFESLGASPWTERARMELRACGQTARSRDPSTLLQLTAQEVQVARFVARGLPTREVAAQMFLSPRTIDYHLRNVFTKLGISSRAELAGLPLD